MPIKPTTTKNGSAPDPRTLALHSIVRDRLPFIERPGVKKEKPKPKATPLKMIHTTEVQVMLFIRSLLTFVGREEETWNFEEDEATSATRCFVGTILP